MIQISFSGKKKDCLQLYGDNSVVSLTREFFSVPNPAHRSNLPYITSRLYSITPGGKFEIGLLKEIISFFEKHRYPFQADPDVYKSFQPGFNNFNIEKLKSHTCQYYAGQRNDNSANC